MTIDEYFENGKVIVNFANVYNSATLRQKRGLKAIIGKKRQILGYYQPERIFSPSFEIVSEKSILEEQQ